MIRSQTLMRREQLRDGKTKVVSLFDRYEGLKTAHKCTIKRNERSWVNESLKETEITETTS